MEANAKELRGMVLQYITSNNLFSRSKKVVVAVSGGADSVCLLHILHSIRPRLRLQLHIAHLDHQLRGSASEADASYVSRLSRRLNIDATIVSRDVNGYRLRRKISLEEASREMRYAFFAEVLSRHCASCVAVAHTRDDHVETILMHLLRGTGTEGLRGLQPMSSLYTGESRHKINIVRPLLQVSRAQTQAYCSLHKLRPRQDASNLSLEFRRNRIRHELLPLLKTYNPGIEEALLRLARIASEEIAFIEEQTTNLWNEIVLEKAGILSLDAEKFSGLHGAVQKQLLRRAVQKILGDTRDLEAVHLEEMLNFLKKPAGKVLHLPHRLRLRREYNDLLLSLEDQTTCPFPSLNKKHKLKVPGQTTLPGWRVTCRLSEERTNATATALVADIDLDKSGMELFVRNRRRGDIFQPLGMGQAKKLHRFMSAVRIPRSWRDSLPLVCTPRQVLWVVGYRIADTVKITGSTAKILNINFERFN